MTPQQPSGGFSLFPNTTTTPPRRTTPRPAGASPVESLPGPIVIPGPYANPNSNAGPTPPPRQGRQTPQARVASPIQQGRPSQEQNSYGHYVGSGRSETSTPVVQQPRHAADVPGRSETAFSQANTLVRSGSTRSRSSIAKRPLDDDAASPDVPGLRSIFPRYNPDVALNQQNYFPTQTSPTDIPVGAFSRPLYSPEPVTPLSPPPHIDAVAHTMTSDGPASQWPPSPRAQPTAPPPLPEVSTTDDLRALWKVTNGWKASQSEGQVFCLQMTQEKDVPVYTLSSTSQPFYNLRVDPTSASAHITLTRHDPAKPCRGPPPSTSSSPSSPSSPTSVRSSRRNAAITDKNWHEVIRTVLEQESRRHRPNDGLVAELNPIAALRASAEKPGDDGLAMLAEQECARLVWDDDSGTHYLVHPALATPFCVTVERFASWGRVEYTLEHHESPNHLARLTRDATGVGYLQVDTALASKIESFYVLDVAVAALLIVACGDKEAPRAVEAFEPPPIAPPPMAHMPSPRSDGFSFMGRGNNNSNGTGENGSGGRRWGRKKTRMEEMEIQDVESQDSRFGKRETMRTRDGLPWPVRIPVKMGLGVGKAVLWVITAVLKVMLKMVVGLAKCLGLVGTTR